ncbi:hypothetical protein GIB67_019687, partial [Kingdonia uniflora]
ENQNRGIRGKSESVNQASFPSIIVSTFFRSYHICSSRSTWIQGKPRRSPVVQSFYWIPSAADEVRISCL